MALNLFQKMISKQPENSGCITSEILSSIENIPPYYLDGGDFLPIKISNVTFNNNVKKIQYVAVSPEFTDTVTFGEGITDIKPFYMLSSTYLSPTTNHSLTVNWYAANASNGDIVTSCFTAKTKGEATNETRNITLNVNIKSSVRKFPARAFYSISDIYTNLTFNLNIEEGMQTLGGDSFPSTANNGNIVFPSTLTTIEGAIDKGSVSGHVFTFKTPAGVAMSIPAAGSSTGMFYNKTAKTMTIYTDNETIKNYNWAGDNVTATIYHLDGTAW